MAAKQAMVKIFFESISAPGMAVCQIYNPTPDNRLENVYQLAFTAFVDVPRLSRSDLRVQLLREELLEGVLAISFVVRVSELPESYQRVNMIRDHYLL